MNYLNLKRFSHHLQVSYTQLSSICHKLYKHYAPDKLTKRRNVNQCTISDPSLLTMLIWQAEIGIESQRRFSHFFSSLSQSRFNRRARQLLPLIQLIRQKINQKVDLLRRFLIVDSFPVPVRQPIRNYRAKIFRGYADIGYKATKKIYYYGFKVHALASDDGYILDYVVTKASVHDAKELTELVENAKPSQRYILGDEGYVGKRLHKEMSKLGYVLWTPYRKNMKGAKENIIIIN